MLTLELAGNKTKVNVTTLMVGVLLRKQVLKNYLILSSAIMKNKIF